jgi:hypothetical protein
VGVPFMVQSTAPLIRPTREHSNEEKDAPQGTTPLLTPSLEGHRLAERVERALRATGYGALHTVRVAVNARVVILGGRVSSYYLKQVAQATTLAVPEVHQIRNGLHFVQPKSGRQKA